MKIDKRKFFGTILGTTMFVVMLLSFTYAYYSWTSGNTTISFSIDDSYFYCESGIESVVNGLSPVSDYRDGSYQMFTVNNVGMSDTNFSLTLNIKEIDERLLSEQFKYRVVVDETGGENDCINGECSKICERDADGNALVDASGNCLTEIGTGDFSDFKVGMNTLVESIFLPNNVRYKFYLFMYIDGNVANTDISGASMESVLEVCEIVVFLDYQGADRGATAQYMKVSGVYDSLPATLIKNNRLITYNLNTNTLDRIVSGDTTSIADDEISYSYDGWYTEKNGNGTKVENGMSVISKTNHTLYVNWLKNPSGVTLPTPVKTGYVFNNWLIGDSKVAADDSIEGGYSPDESVTLNANWTPNTYTINLELNDGKISGISSGTEVTFGNEVTINNPTKTFTLKVDDNGQEAEIGEDVTQALTFNGWSATNLNTSTAQYGSSLTAWNSGNTLVKATKFRNLRSESGTVTLSTNWGEPSAMLVPSVTKEGYFCYASNLLNGEGEKFYAGTSYRPGVNENTIITLFAFCDINTAEITIRRDGTNYSDGNLKVALYLGEEKIAESITVNGIAEFMSSDDEIINSGTYKIYASKSVEEIDTLVDTGETITISNAQGKATIDYYTLDINLELENGINTHSGTGIYLKNQDVNISAEVQEGYNFSEWIVEEGDTPSDVNATNTTVKMTKKTTLTPKAVINTEEVVVDIYKNDTPWEDNGITIELYNTDTSISSHLTENVSESAISFDVAAGCYELRVSSSSNDVDSLSTANEFCVVTEGANIRIDYYELILNAGSNIASVIGNGVYLKGQTVNINATATEGATFEAWSISDGDSPNNVNSSNTTLVVTKKTVLTATAVYIPITVTFNHGSTELASLTCTYGETLSMPNESDLPFENNYASWGWKLEGWTYDNGLAPNYLVGEEIDCPSASFRLYTSFSRAITFYSGDNAGVVDGEITQYLNSYNNSTSPFSYSFISAPVTGWEPLPYYGEADSFDQFCSNNKSCNLAYNHTPNVYSIYQRTLTFYSGVNASIVDGTSVQYLNPYNNTTSNVTPYAPSAVTNWSVVTYGIADSLVSSCDQTNTSCNPVYTSSNKLYAIYQRTLTFYSGENAGIVDGTRTQYMNSYNNTVSAVTTFTPSEITNWSSRGYRNDGYALTQAIGCTSGGGDGCKPAYNNSNNLYAVYARTLTFYSGENAGIVDGTRTQYMNSYNNTTSNVTSYTPSTITNWTSEGYRLDTDANAFSSSNGCEVDENSCNPSYDSGNSLYALYQRTLTVYYDGNGNTGGTPPQNNTLPIYLNTSSTTTSDQSVELASNEFKRDKWKFLYWTEGSVDGTRYDPGETYNPNLAYDAESFDIIMYANWSKSRAYIIYNVNGGTVTPFTETPFYNADGSVDDITYWAWKTDDNGNIYRAVDTVEWNEENLENVYWSSNYMYISTSQRTKLYEPNNQNKLNITKAFNEFVVGAEWICMEGCTTPGRTYDVSVSHGPEDFCDITDGDCTVTLGVNWKYKLVPATTTEEISDLLDGLWSDSRYVIPEVGDILYASDDGEITTYHDDGTEYSTIIFQKHLSTKIPIDTVVYLEKNDDNELMHILQYSDFSSMRIWVNVNDIEVDIDGYDLDSITINGETYYALYYSATSLDEDLFTNIGDVND